MFAKFTDDLLTGCDLIDNQHREWFKRLDNFWKAAREGHGKDEVVDALIFLCDYVKTHFDDEEKLQQEHAYPGFESHKKQHESFRHNVDNLLASLQRRGADYSVIIDTLNSMLEWVTKHIKNMDKDFSNYIQAKSKTSTINK